MSVDIPSVPPFDPDRDYWQRIGIDHRPHTPHVEHTDDFAGIFPPRHAPATDPANLTPLTEPTTEHAFLYGDDSGVWNGPLDRNGRPFIAAGSTDRPASSQAGLASFRPLMDRIGPGAADMVERELARAKAFEVIARAAVAYLDADAADKAWDALREAVAENRGAL